MKKLRFSSLHWFGVFWLLMAGLALWVHYSWNVNPDFLGVVETRTHKLSAQEPGRIARIFVILGQQVRTNEVLVTLDTSDLDTEQAWLEKELTRLETQMEADRDRYALEYAKLRMQVEADQWSIESRQAELEAKRAELKAVDAEIARLTAAQDAGLGRSRDLSDLTIQHDGLARYVEQKASSLARESSHPGRSSAPAGESTAQKVVISMLAESQERIHEVELKLKIIKSRKDRRQVISPCDGRVVNVDFLPGDAVDAFIKIVTIEEPQADFIDVYIPETSDHIPTLGQRVAIHPHRSAAREAGGRVIFIDPGYSAIPERLAFRGMIYWARKFRVLLDPGHTLMPGEAVQVEMLRQITLGVAPMTLAAAHAADPPPTAPAAPDTPAVVAAKDRPLPMTVPPELTAITPFEPSGLRWLADLDRFLVVSDDTGRGNNAHTPLVFLMDRDGHVDKTPVRLEGVAEVRDLESVSQGPDGFIYLLSSQSVSKKGNRPQSRQLLLKVRRQGRTFTVVDRVALLDALVKTHNSPRLKDLGLTKTEEHGNLVLNIEGSTWLGDALLLGLKEPRSGRGAIVWRLADPDALFRTKQVSPGQLTVLGYADIRTPEGAAASISSLAADHRGRVYALSTVANVPAGGQTGGFHRLSPGKAGNLEVTTLATFPGLKPEGVSIQGSRAVIVFDCDRETPRYFTTELPEP